MSGGFTERVRESLAKLRALDPEGKRVFGAMAHLYELGDPISASDISDFEKEFQVALPDDYRSFLSDLGDGGAGPFYGVLRLGEVDDGADFQEWEDSHMVGDIGKPFPYRETWNLSPEVLAALDESDDDDDLEREDWKPIDGAIPLCHEGCALRDWLVVSGPERGHMWHDGRADNEGWRPILDERGQRVTFEAWYSEWLEKALTTAQKI